MTAYTARAQGDSPDWAPLEVQFADFAIWQHTVLSSADDAESVIGRQLSYWRSQLAGAGRSPSCPPTAHVRRSPRTPAPTSSSGSARVSDRVAAVAGEFGVTRSWWCTPRLPRCWPG